MWKIPYTCYLNQTNICLFLSCLISSCLSCAHKHTRTECVLVNAMLMAVIQNSFLLLLCILIPEGIWGEGFRLLTYTHKDTHTQTVCVVFLKANVVFLLLNCIFNNFSLSLLADSKQDEADGGQLRGRPSEISKLRATQQSQALPRPGESSTQGREPSRGINL